MVFIPQTLAFAECWQQLFCLEFRHIETISNPQVEPYVLIMTFNSDFEPLGIIMNFNVIIVYFRLNFFTKELD